MSLFTMDLGNLSYAAIEELCRENRPESVVLDYKGNLAQDAPERHVVKHVSALANTQGGLLLFGITTTKTAQREYPKFPLRGMPVDAGFAQKVRGWCLTRIYPPLVPEIGYVVRDNATGRAFAVVRVDESLLTPHTVEGGTRVYVRRADNSLPVEATEDERQLLRNRRAKQVELEEAHREDLFYRISGKPDQGDVTLLLTVCPRLSRDDAIPRERLIEAAAPFGKDNWIEGSTPTSYSHGIVFRSDRTNRNRFAVTTRAAFGRGRVIRFRPVPRDTWLPRLRTFELLRWAVLAVQGSVILAKMAEFRGEYEMQLKADGWEGARIIEDDPNNVIARCADNRISVPGQWRVEEAEESPTRVGAALARRICWAFGLRWEEESLRESMAIVGTGLSEFDETDT